MRQETSPAGFLLFKFEFNVLRPAGITHQDAKWLLQLRINVYVTTNSSPALLILIVLPSEKVCNAKCSWKECPATNEGLKATEFGLFALSTIFTESTSCKRRITAKSLTEIQKPTDSSIAVRSWIARFDFSKDCNRVIFCTPPYWSA